MRLMTIFAHRKKYLFLVVFGVFISPFLWGSESYRTDYGNWPCPDHVKYDVDSIRGSGNGEIINEYYNLSVKHDGDDGKYEEVNAWVDRYWNSNMDAALIKALSRDNGGFPDPEDLKKHDLLYYEKEWISLDDYPHMNAARLYLLSQKRGHGGPPGAYGKVRFLASVANKDVKPLIDEYLDFMKGYMDRKSMLKWADKFGQYQDRVDTAIERAELGAKHIAFCNGLELANDPE